MLRRRFRLSRSTVTATLIGALLSLAAATSVFAGNGQGPWP